VTVGVNRDNCPCVPRRALGYRRQTVEQMTWHDAVSVQGGEVLDLGEERSLADEAAVVKRFSQRLFGVARRQPPVQTVEPLDLATTAASFLCGRAFRD
jgi:hypothetical protein